MDKPIKHEEMEVCGYKGEHHCWVKRCECGWINWGCVKMGISCKSCGESIKFFDYSKIYMSKETLQDLMNWGEPTQLPSLIQIYSGLGIDFKEDYQI